MGLLLQLCLLFSGSYPSRSHSGRAL